MKSGLLAFFIGFSVLGFIVLMVWASYALTPWFRDAETKATEHSYTYVETKRELLLKLAEDVHKLDVRIAATNDPNVLAELHAQRQATIDRMRAEAALISPEEIPPSVKPLL